MKAPLVSCLLLGPALLFSCSEPTEAHEGQSTNGGSAKTQEGAEQREAHRVRVVKLVPRPVEERLPCTSHVEAFHQVPVLSQATGQVLEVFVDEGKRVKKDDVLFRLDERQARLNLETAKNAEKDARTKKLQADLALREADNRVAEAQLEHEQAIRKLERAKKSRAERLASVTELEDAQLACDKCKTALDIAGNAKEKAELGKKEAETQEEAAIIRRKLEERMLEDYTVLAPISGVVSKTMIRGGEWVGPQTELCVVVDNKNLILHVNRPQKELAVLRIGQRVDIEIDAFEEPFAGEIDLIAPVVDLETGTFRARVRVTDEKGVLRPGMFCRAWIVTGTSRDALMIPKNAIVYEGDRPFAFVVRNDKAIRIPIERGISLANELEARNRAAEPRPDAFVAGDRVISEGRKNLEAGREVKVENE